MRILLLSNLYPPDAMGGYERGARQVADALAAVARATREAIDDADRAGDKGTSDLFTELSRDLDKLLWLVEAHLQSPK